MDTFNKLLLSVIGLMGILVFYLIFLVQVDLHSLSQEDWDEANDGCKEKYGKNFEAQRKMLVPFESYWKCAYDKDLFYWERGV